MKNQEKAKKTTSPLARKYATVSQYSELSDTELAIVAGGFVPVECWCGKAPANHVVQKA